MEHIFRQWIGMHRAMIAWFHAAHHVTKGTGFGGDHVNIYGEIYNTLDEDLDQIVEKGIGLTGDESLADPVSSLSMAAGLLAQQPASANQDAETIACNAFEVIKYYVKSIEGIYSQFEACGMSLGLDDLLQGLANQYETYVYLLQQRSRSVSLNKSPVIAITEERLRHTLRKAILLEVKTTQFGDLTWGIWSMIKNLAYRMGKGQRDQPSVEKAMKYIANIAGYVLEDAIEEATNYEEDAQTFTVDYIMNYARQNRKKSMKSFCFAFIDGLYNFLTEYGEGMSAEDLYRKQIFRIMNQDGNV